MPTLVTETEKMFPYGTFPVDSLFKDCYTQDYSRAQNYPLPDALPHHHPLLKRLEGVYPLYYSLPPWWHEQVAQVESVLLKPLLSSVSAQEFRAGCLDLARWKAFRESLSEEERRQLPTSPKLTIMVEETGWSARFWNRGPADTADRFNLVISTRPLDFLYMSTISSDGWEDTIPLFLDASGIALQPKDHPEKGWRYGHTRSQVGALPTGGDSSRDTRLC